ncbi:coiled-coil-helix-coiled-coil-helix domain-containing protein 10, mitochondrial-like [Chenopodium quinoa]|uniref:coiled-coil-helix-coiled-coil-helix domain-containing protein 10, mitochondrial-like n=1 Tax=Chenopodium quinoa TaxID=63459 RepID=UPI000B76E88E|nr:coiled-coil-helix-coiled-coil-helix domain-containing protein 10, mitochondrial-like [Chenopodium quinoa]
MPRRSGGGRSAPRPTAPPVRNPPQPAQRAPPPAPAPASCGGSMLGGLNATIAQGVAFGTGSAVAHRAVDAVVGPRTIQHETVVNEAAGASPASVNNNVGDACGIHNKAFQDCLNNFGSEISRCQFYLDKLSECRKNSGIYLVLVG